MRTNNIASEGLRISEIGLVYKEVLSNASGSIEVMKFSAVRVRAVAATTIIIDGMLSATLIPGEIILVNVRRGTDQDNKNTVTVVFSGAVYAQVGLEVTQV